MIHPTCARPDCQRARVRRFGDDWWCLYHPYGEPPATDPKTGRPVEHAHQRRQKAALQLQPEFDEAAA